MTRNHLTPILAVLALGAATLTGCGSSQVPPGPARAVDLGSSQPAAPGGGAGPALLSGTAKSNNSAEGTGDWAVPNGGVATGSAQESAQRWTQLTASRVAKLDSVVVNGAGLTLYRFAKDTKPGDTLGQGVGGTWFGVTPVGGKAGVPGGEQATPDASPASPATSAVFFDDPNFGDGAGSQGVAGTGCRNLDRPGAASSVAAPGSLKIWAGKDCTGRSQVINGDVADLGTVGFDNAVVSVRLG